MFQVVAAAAGVVVLILVWSSVLRTTLVNRRSPSRMARWTATACAAAARMAPSRIGGWLTAFCVPGGLFLMVIGWLLGLAVGFLLLAAAVGVATLDQDGTVRLAGLDVSPAADLLTVLAVVSALLLLSAFTAHLVHFLSAYHRRERMVLQLAARVRLVTDADRLLADHLRAGSRDALDEYFAKWADWLSDINESHNSYPGLVYHKSAGNLCWPKAALIVLDAAALVMAVAPNWAPLHTRILLDCGSACLQPLARRIGIVLPAMTVSLHGREERTFGDTMRLATDAGLPAEREMRHAWTDFQRTRVQYAPYAVFIGSRLVSPMNNVEAR